MNIKITGDEFLNYVIDILSPLYQIKTLKMFGGYGIYINEKIVAFIAEQELYLKINHTATEFFKKLILSFFSIKEMVKLSKYPIGKLLQNCWKIKNYYSNTSIFRCKNIKTIKYAKASLFI